MTTGRREVDNPREDALLSRLYQQVTEQQAARFADGYDMPAGLARYRAWLGEHTAAQQQARPQEIPAAAPLQPPPAPPGPPARLRGRVPSPRRRWGAWLAPVTAAALVVAVAATLVIVRDMPDGHVKPPTASSAPASPTGPVAPIAGVPQYYVTQGAPVPGTDSWKLVIGDTFTGKRVATIAPPRGTSWGSMTGAADDRTFVVSNIPPGYSSGGVPVTWYLLRITPGENPGYRLTRLAIPDMKPWCVEAIGLSGSGRELAMTLAPVPTRSDRNPALWVLRTYSVATGKLLGNWSVNGTTSLDTGITVPGVESPTLKWVNGDRGIAFYTYNATSNTRPAVPESVRLLNVTGGSGNLIADSKFIWSTKVAVSAQGFIDTVPLGGRCLWNGDESTRPQVTTDGKTVVCVTGSIGAKQGRSRVTFEWLAYSARAPKVPHILYKVTTNVLLGLGTTSSVLWSGTSSSPMIVEWATEALPPNKYQNAPWHTHFGVVSHGQFHPLPLPSALTPGSPSNGSPIAW